MKKHHFIKWRLLSVQIILYLLISMTALLSIYIFSTYHTFSSILLEKTRIDTLDSINRSSEYVSGYVDRLKRATDVMANNREVKNFVENNSSESKDKALTIMRTILETDESFVSAFVISRDGHLLSSESSPQMTTSKDMMEEDWYLMAIERKGQPVLTSEKSTTLSSHTDNWVISITEEVVSKSGENIGVVRMDINYKVFDTYLSQLKLGENGTVFLINQKDQLIYHQDRAAFSNQILQSSIQKDNKKKDGYDKKKKELVYHQKVPKTDWTLVGVASLDELLMVSNSLRRMLLIISGLMLIIILIGSIVVVKILIKPLRSLEYGMQNVVFGFSDAKVEEKGSDEIRSLAISFNIMLKQMEELIVKGKTRDKAIHEHELNALAAQINPHFLYNTLDTIIWMAEFNDNQMVIETTKSLANFFRLSLNQGNEIISLKNEIDHVRQYLFIQEKRYEEQLNYQIIEDPNLYNYQLPKLILQPIVENAIYHGIKEIDRPGFIRIRTYEDRDNFYIEVYDNGRGFSQENELEVKNMKLGGVGLANIDERLRLQYGEDYEMIIQSEINKYTLILLKMPKNN